MGPALHLNPAMNPVACWQAHADGASMAAEIFSFLKDVIGEQHFVLPLSDN